jgi:GNAT superfamily N-acetyltransferase
VNNKSLVIRLAQSEDIDELTSIRYSDNKVIHIDRITASPELMRYFVAEKENRIMGFALLILQAYPGSNHDHPLYPNITDLFVSEKFRNQGIGSALLEQICVVSKQIGFNELYISVDPHQNKNAMLLYEKQGFVKMQNSPYEDKWKFTDSSGKEHSGIEWLIDMRKAL